MKNPDIMPMVDPLNLKLIRQAQAGNEQSLAALSEQARCKVYNYVYRLTLDYHLSQDLTQETVLEMIKALPRLDLSHENFFWAWIYRTALGKVQHHFRPQGTRRIAQKTTRDSTALADPTSTFNIVIRRELHRAVLNAMNALHLRYRNVLVLRCFDDLSFSEIAMIMGGNEPQARLLFFRAKRSLKSRLKTHGLTRKSLLSVMTIFAGLTAGTGKKVAAGEVVMAASLKTGIWTGLISLCTSKAMITGACVLLVAGFTATQFLPTSTKRLQNNSVDRNLLALRNSDVFAPPSRIVGVHDPDRDGFRAIDLTQPSKPARVIQPEHILIHASEHEQRGLIIPPEHWVEMAFEGSICDGPGPDLLISGWGCRHLRVVVTDGVAQTFELPRSVCLHYCWGYHILAFDLAGENVPFEPQAIRILGATSIGRQGGFELTACHVRIR